MKGFAIAAGILLAQLSSSAVAQTEFAKPAPRKEWPIEAFAELPLMERPTLSPDGTHVAARIARNGEMALVIIALADRPDRIRMLSVGENDLNWLRWVNEEWLIAGLSTETSIVGDPMSISRVASIKADGTKVNLIAKATAAQNADDVIWVAHDGSPRILLSYQTSLYNDIDFWPRVDEVDITNGKLRPLVRPHENVFNWYADAAGAVRMGVGYSDGTRMSKLLYRADGKGSFRVIDRADARQKESLVVPMLFSTDTGKAIAVDDHEGTDALYELDLNTLKLGTKIFSAPGVDISSVETNDAGTELLGARYIADAPAVHWFNPGLAKVQADLDKAVGNRRAAIVSTSRDNNRMIVHVGSADQPGYYYFYDTSQGVMKPFSPVSNSFGPSTHLSPVKTIRYKARDGLEIAAVLTLPAGKDPKSLPLILMPHDGPFARDSEEWDWWVQFLAYRGYAVLQPNYRGSSGYGTAFAEKGEGQWGLAMQDDLNDAVDWAVKEGIADAKRVCIAGASYGGYAAMRAAQRDGTKFRCAISYAGVSDLAAMMRYDRRFLYHNTSKDWLQKQAPDFTAVSPVNFAAQFSTPILLMHGKKDRRVQVNQSREMARKLKLAGKVDGRDFIYVEQPLADHFFSRQADRLDFLQRMDAFLKEHNPA